MNFTKAAQNYNWPRLQDGKVPTKEFIQSSQSILTFIGMFN